LIAKYQDSLQEEEKTILIESLQAIESAIPLLVVFSPVFKI
jgi:hypothetical protein